MNVHQAAQSAPSIAAAVIANAILVHEDGGTVKHVFTTKAEALQGVDASIAKGINAVAHIFDEGMPADMVLSISPRLQARIEEQKATIRREIEFNRIMDENGVRADPAARARIARAMQEERSNATIAALYSRLGGRPSNHGSSGVARAVSLS